MAGARAIGAECKKVGALNEGQCGDSKGYFSAVQTSTLGILTDRIMWKRCSDTSHDNMMDDAPFVTIDLRDVATGSLADHQLDALQRLRREVFNPGNVVADARRKLHVAAYIGVLEKVFAQPDEGMVRTLMAAAGIDGRRTGRMLDEQAPEVSHAILCAFIDAHREAYGVEPICRVLEIAPSGYYIYRQRQADATRQSARACQ